MEEPNEYLTDNAKDITIDDFTDALVAIDPTPVSDGPEPTAEVEEEIVDTAETEETDQDVDDDYLAEVDTDEADDSQEETEADEAPEDEAQETYTFKADGEEVTVTLDELKKSFGLQKNLTRKGQETAEKEKQLEQEAQVLMYYKQTPERQQLIDKIQYAEDVIQRGTAFDKEGNQIPLTQQQIQQTQENIAKAKEEYSQMATPPEFERARQEIPELWTGDEAKRTTALKRYGDYLMSVGYSQAELNHISPRELLLAKAALDGIELDTRVKAAKARKSKKTKPGVVSKVTKAATGRPEKSTQRGTGKRKMSEAEMAKKIESGEMEFYEAFMDID